jgi:methionine-rich copper-binding protein CopC
VASLVGLAWLALVPVPDASAHAGYDHSTPEDGEVVAEPPAVVDLYFGQEMARSAGLPTAVVVNASGDQVDLGATLDDDDRTHISVEMPPAMPEGRYTVIWHTLSDEDGEEAQGAFHYYVGTGPTPVATGETTTGNATGAPTETRTIPARPSPVSTEASTAAPSDGGDGDSGVPVWALVLGVIGGLVVGGGGAMVLAGRKTN